MCPMTRPRITASRFGRRGIDDADDGSIGRHFLGKKWEGGFLAPYVIDNFSRACPDGIQCGKGAAGRLAVIAHVSQQQNLLTLEGGVLCGGNDGADNSSKAHE